MFNFLLTVTTAVEPVVEEVVTTTSEGGFGTLIILGIVSLVALFFGSKMIGSQNKVNTKVNRKIHKINQEVAMEEIKELEVKSNQVRVDLKRAEEKTETAQNRIEEILTKANVEIPEILKNNDLGKTKKQIYDDWNKL